MRSGEPSWMLAFARVTMFDGKKCGGYIGRKVMILMRGREKENKGEKK